MFDRNLIGNTSRVYEFEVEKGAIRAFASALGEDNPLYFDEAYAKEQGYASLVAPPTFAQTLRIPFTDLNVNVDKSRTLQGEQEYIYERPIVAGDVFRCVSTLVDINERQGKSGTMISFIYEIRGEDLKGNFVFLSRTTVIYR